MAEVEVLSSSPGLDKVVRRMVNGQEFGCRRPMRGDDAEICRRYAAKLVVTGLEVESHLLNAMDGENLLWEARLQVCLKTRQLSSKVLDWGETAPAHWLRDGSIAFDNVPVDEFEAVTKEFAPLFARSTIQRTPQPAAPPPPAGE